MRSFFFLLLMISFSFSSNAGFIEESLEEYRRGTITFETFTDRLREDNTCTKLALKKEDNIGTVQIIQLGFALVKNKKLEELELKGISLKINGTNSGMLESLVSLKEMIKQNRTLKRFTLSDVDISSVSAGVLGSALTWDNGNIEYFDLSGLNLGDGVKEFGISFNLYKMKELILDRNNIGDIGAVSLGAGLVKNTTITALDLFSNNIGNDGAAELAKGLSGNNTLTRLHLQKNKIGDEGTQALARALRVNTSLRQLYIQSNLIGIQGFKYIAEALRSNIVLQSLWIGENNPSEDSLIDLCDAVLSNGKSALIALNLESTSVGDIAANKFKRLVDLNDKITVTFTRNRLSNATVLRVKNNF